MIEDIFLYYRGSLQLGIVLALAIWAYRKGDGPEKACGAILLGMLLADYPHHWLFPTEYKYGDIIVGHLVIDAATFAALVPLSMRANRIYPLWLLAAQLIALMMHFQREIVPDIPPLAYYVLTHGPSWVQVIAFAVGLVAHRRRMARYGSYRSWRTFSGRSSAATLDR